MLKIHQNPLTDVLMTSGGHNTLATITHFQIQDDNVHTPNLASSTTPELMYMTKRVDEVRISSFWTVKSVPHVDYGAILTTASRMKKEVIKLLTKDSDPEITYICRRTWWQFSHEWQSGESKIVEWYQYSVLFMVKLPRHCLLKLNLVLSNPNWLERINNCLYERFVFSKSRMKMMYFRQLLVLAVKCFFTLWETPKKGRPNMYWWWAYS